MTKPTVVIANGIMDAGGTESLIMEILRHSSGVIHYIMLIHYVGTKRRGFYDDEIEKLGVKILHIPSVGTVGIKRYTKLFQQIASRTGKVDAIHCHLNANAGIICRAAKKSGIPIRISHCHADIKFTGDIMSRMKNEFELQVLRALIAKYATDYWACSAAAWKRLFYPWKHRVVVSNMIDTEKYLSSPQQVSSVKEKYKLTDKTILGSIGRVAPIKNIETAIKATAQLVKEGYNVEYICFGRFDANDPYCQSLLKITEELGITECVRFMGNSTKVHEDIRSIDIFLMPSFTEGFGIAALEAQAAGLPCVVSSGVPKSIDAGLGLVEFINPRDVRRWCEGIKRAFSMKRLSHSDILEAFKSKGLDSEAGTQDIESKYLSIING